MNRQQHWRPFLELSFIFKTLLLNEIFYPTYLFLNFSIKLGYGLVTSIDIFNLFLLESHLLCKFRFLTQLKGHSSHFCTVKHQTLAHHVAQWHRIWTTCWHCLQTLKFVFFVNINVSVLVSCVGTYCAEACDLHVNEFWVLFLTSSF